MGPNLLLNMHSLSHMVVFVTLEGQLWLADVGFGDSAATQPLLIQEGPSVVHAGQVRH